MLNVLSCKNISNLVIFKDFLHSTRIETLGNLMELQCHLLIRHLWNVANTMHAQFCDKCHEMLSVIFIVVSIYLYHNTLFSPQAKSTYSDQVIQINYEWRVTEPVPTSMATTIFHFTRLGASTFPSDSDSESAHWSKILTDTYIIFIALYEFKRLSDGF